MTRVQIRPWRDMANLLVLRRGACTQLITATDPFSSPTWFDKNPLNCQSSRPHLTCESLRVHPYDSPATYQQLHGRNGSRPYGRPCVGL